MKIYLCEDKEEAHKDGEGDEEGQDPEGRAVRPAPRQHEVTQKYEQCGGRCGAEQRRDEPGGDDGDDALPGGEGGGVGARPQDTCQRVEQVTLSSRKAGETV